MTPLAARPVLVLLGRPGCHLCEEFEEALRGSLPADAFRLERAPVDARTDWQAEYGREIPVLLTEAGQVLCRTRLDLDVVRAHLHAQSRA